MTLYLGLDTAAPIGLVFLGTEEKVLAGVCFPREAASQKMVTAVDEVLQQAGRPRDRIEAVIVNPGPGSLTGIKVGLAFARTFCQVNNLPLVGVSALDALAYSLQVSARQVVPAGPVPPVFLPMMRAVRGEVYYAFYSPESDAPASRPPERITEYQRVSADSLISALESAGAAAGDQAAPLVFGGDAAPDHTARLKKLGAVVSDTLFPTAIGYLQCAASQFPPESRVPSRESRSWSSVEPIYLYPPPVQKPRNSL